MLKFEHFNIEALVCIPLVFYSQSMEAAQMDGNFEGRLNEDYILRIGCNDEL